MYFRRAAIGFMAPRSSQYSRHSRRFPKNEAGAHQEAAAYLATGDVPAPTQNDGEDEVDPKIKDSERCWGELYNETLEQCPGYGCVGQALRAKGSWAADFLADGWLVRDDHGTATPAPNQRTTYGKLMYAAHQAGLGSDSVNITPDDAAAERTLRGLARAEPQNGYYLFLLALIASKRGDHETANQLLHQAAASEMHFDSHELDLKREIYQTNLDSMTHTVAATLVESRLPVISIRDWQYVIDENSDVAAVLGQKMIAGAATTLKPRNPSQWSPLMMALGRAFYHRAGGSDFDIPDMRQMMRDSYEGQFGSSGQVDCRAEELQFMRALKSDF